MRLITSIDVFALGIGLDIAGGYLVARGLLVSPGEILRRSLNDEHYFIPDATASMIADRVDAQIGLILLLGGFATQGLGYALVAGDFSGFIQTNHRLAPAALAISAAVASSATALLAWRLLRWPFVRELILVVARDPLRLGANYFLTGEGRGKVSYHRLSALGAKFGRQPLPGEDPSSYALRVFDVDDLDEEPDLLASAFHPARLT
jgi:hypothetical protein